LHLHAGLQLEVLPVDGFTLHGKLSNYPEAIDFGATLPSKQLACY
jgi:hypothetical protein